MRYAMILRDSVVDILYEKEEIPVWPPGSDGSVVTALPCDDTVMVGMSYDWDTNRFYEPEPPEIVEPEPTQLDRIEEKLSVLAAESVTVTNVETAILEGVSEV